MSVGLRLVLVLQLLVLGPFIGDVVELVDLVLGGNDGDDVLVVGVGDEGVGGQGNDVVGGGGAPAALKVTVGLGVGEAGVEERDGEEEEEGGEDGAGVGAVTGPAA